MVTHTQKLSHHTTKNVTLNLKFLLNQNSFQSVISMKSVCGYSLLCMHVCSEVIVRSSEVRVHSSVSSLLLVGNDHLSLCSCAPITNGAWVVFRTGRGTDGQTDEAEGGLTVIAVHPSTSFCVLNHVPALWTGSQNGAFLGVVNGLGGTRPQ